MARILRLYTPDYKTEDIIDLDEAIDNIDYTEMNKMLGIVEECEDIEIVDRDAIKPLFKTKFGICSFKDLSMGAKTLMVLGAKSIDGAVNISLCGDAFVPKAVELGVENNKSIILNGSSALYLPTKIKVDEVYLNDSRCKSVFGAKYNALSIMNQEEVEIDTLEEQKLWGNLE